MCVAAHVDRHSRQIGRKVCAVVEVHAAEVVLIGLTLTTVLGSHHTRSNFCELADTLQWAGFEIPEAY